MDVFPGKSVNEDIHTQIAFLDQLKNSNPADNEPRILFHKFSTIIKKVYQQRQKKQFEKKWHTFLEKQICDKSASHLTIDTNEEKSTKNNNNKNYSENSNNNLQIISNTSKFGGGSYMKPENSIFLETQSDQKNASKYSSSKKLISDNHEHDFIQLNTGNKMVLPICDLYSILKQVKRKRKQQRDEQKWENFLVQKEQIKMTQGHVNEMFTSCKDNYIINKNEKENPLGQNTTKVNILKECETETDIDTPFYQRGIGGDLQESSENYAQYEMKFDSNLTSEICCLMENRMTEREGYINNTSEQKVNSLEKRLITTADEKEKDNVINIKLDVEKRKMSEIFTKITTHLLNIYDIIKNINLPSKEDLPIRKRRTSQFIVRLKKDFLYRINCQVDQIKSMLPVHGTKPNLTLVSKLASTYLGVLRAIQIIEKHLQGNIIVGEISETLCSFFNCINDLVSLGIFNEDFQNSEIISKLLSGLCHEIRTIPSVEKLLDPKKHQISRKPENKSSPSIWMKKSTTLARLKFGPPVRTTNLIVNTNNKPKKKDTYASTDMSSGILQSFSSFCDAEKMAEFIVPALSVRKIYGREVVPVYRYDSLNIFKMMNLEPPSKGNETFITMDEDLENISSLSEGTASIKKDGYENSHYVNSSNFVESKSSQSKMIAKKIQEIPGVDVELKKIEDIRMKILSILLHIKSALNCDSTNSLPTDEDLERIMNRTLAFSARFKSNYFYQTNRQLQELKTDDFNPVLIKKKSQIVLVIQKLTTAHQSVLQALQVIEKQFNKVLITGLIPEPLNSFYDNLCELSFLLKPFYGYLKTQIIDDVEKIILDTKELMKSHKRTKLDRFIMKDQTKSNCKGQKPGSNQNRSKLRKKPEKILLKKAHLFVTKPMKKISKQALTSNSNAVCEVKKPPEESKDGKCLNFMMSIKQRPGAEVRQRVRTNEYVLEDPKTMVEILEEYHLDVANSVDNEQNINIKTLKSEVDRITSNLHLEPKIPQESSCNNNLNNVKLITMKRIEDDEKSPADKSVIGDYDWEDLIEYKHEFKKYKKTNPLYNKKSLQTLRNITEKLMDEALCDAIKSVLNKIEMQDLTTLANIIEDELK